MRTEQEPKQFRMQRGCKVAVYASAAAGAIVFIIFFLSNFINGYLENRIEREFTKKYPAVSLKISGLNVNIWRNRIGWDSLMINSADSGFSCNVGAAGVTGVGWLHLMGQGMHKEKTLSNVVANAQNILMKFPRSDYKLSCKRLHLSMPDGEIVVGAVDLKPVEDDEHYFIGKKYRSTRFRFNIPECRVTGLAVAELLGGRGYHTRSIRLEEPSFDALVDMYVPIDPGILPSRMPNEIMNSMNKNIQIENLQITNGKLKYGEIYAPGAMPGSVTFDNMQLQAERIANHRKPEETTVIHGQAIFMQGGIMKLDIAIPLSSPEFSLKYSGSLSAMGINRLNQFLEHSEYLRINSGVIVRTITYDVQVISGHASGKLNALYQDLKISILNKKTGNSHGIINEITSYFTNQFKIRNENIPDKQGALNIGKVEYKRQSPDTFIQFLWFSLRSGVLDVLFKKMPGI